MPFNTLCAQLNVVIKPETVYSTCPKNGIVTPAENGIKYHFCSNTCQRIHLYNIDKGLLNKRTTGRDACDWLLLIEETKTGSPHGCFVELKKGDAEKAFSQLQDTLKQFDEKGWLQKISKRYARIVANSIPANTGNSVIEKAKQIFKKHYQCELKPLRPGKTDTINF